MSKQPEPIVKWAGGKRQLQKQILERIPDRNKISTFYEPFVGGGAVLFGLQPKKAVINDINSELMNLYEVVRDNVEELIELLRHHKNDEDYFYKIRNMDRAPETFSRMTKVERASRMHYLNKTCYNGLFRVNQKGQFNTPFGRYKNPNFVNAEGLRAVSEYFNANNITFKCGDFEEAVKWARRPAFVYFDPPYDPVSPSANFTGYAEGGFDRYEQIRLKELCDRLDKRGIKFLLSNSDTTFIRDLYSEYKVETIQARRSINSDATSRGKINEVLVRNY